MTNKTHHFDEESALQALEQLRDQIQRARSRREQKVAEFEAFLRSNRAASQAERSAALDELERTIASVAGAARGADRAGDSSLLQNLSPGPPRAPRARSLPRFEPIESLPPRDRDPFAVSPPVWSDRRFQIAAGIAALLILVFLLARPWAGDPATQTDFVPPSREAASSGQAPEAPVASRGVEQTPAAARPPSTGALQIELTTSRPVWMRVVVDGERQIQRQVPTGQRLAFGAERAIVLRAGDAGAVRLSVDGVDRGTLGRDGQVVNRTFAPAR